MSEADVKDDVTGDDTDDKTDDQDKTLLGGGEDDEVSRDTDDDKGEKDDKDDEERKDDKDDEGEKGEKSDKDDEKAGAPEEYSDFTIPDGFEVDDKRLSSFQEFGRKHDLSQEAAQSLVDLHVSAIQEVTEEQAAAWKTIKDGWADEVRADKSLQDEDGKSDAAIAVAVKAVEALGGDDLKAALNITGAGSHPAVVRAFYQIGKRMEDDTLVFGSGSEGETKTGAKALYHSMK